MYRRNHIDFGRGDTFGPDRHKDTRDGVNYYIIACLEKHELMFLVLPITLWPVHLMIYYCLVMTQTGHFIFPVYHIELMKRDSFVMPGC